MCVLKKIFSYKINYFSLIILNNNIKIQIGDVDYKNNNDDVIIINDYDNSIYDSDYNNISWW